MKGKFIATGIIASSMLTFMSGCGRTEINMNDYLIISYDGYDTIGTAEYSIDVDSLIENNTKAFERKDSNPASAKSQLKTLLKGELDKTENLSNGDTVTFKWNESDKEIIEKNYKVTLNFADKTDTVSGCKEPESFDPFEYLNCEFDGIIPYALPRISAKENMPVDLRFYDEKGGYVQNGDKVHIKLVVPDNTEELSVEEYCLRSGYAPTETETDVTVEGLSCYPQTIAEIPKDAFDELNSHGQDIIKSDLDANKKLDSLKEFTLLGNYMLQAQVTTGRIGNLLYFVYKIDIDSNGSDLSYYNYVSYDDIVLHPDGTCTFDVNTAETAEGGYLNGEAFQKDGSVYHGFEDLDTFFSEHIKGYMYDSTIK